MLPIPHKPRFFTQVAGAIYILPSDEGERARLSMQQALLRRLYDGRLILPPVVLTPDSKVLDCGTGPGVWLLDLVKEVPPSTTLIGSDIEPVLFPKEHPDNMQFCVASALELPSKWSDTFTLVHQRLMLGSITKDEWVSDLKELYRVLAPGGWVQLCEMGGWPEGPITSRIYKPLQAMWDKRDIFISVTGHLPKMLADAGFVDVHVEERAIPTGKWAGHDGIEGRDDLIGIWRGMKIPVLDGGGFGYIHSEEEYDDLLEAVAKEWDENPGSSAKIVTVYAQKPK